MYYRRLRRKLYRQLAGAIAASTLILIPVATTIASLLQWLASDPVETGLTIVAIFAMGAAAVGVAWDACGLGTTTAARASS